MLVAPWTPPRAGRPRASTIETMPVNAPPILARTPPATSHLSAPPHSAPLAVGYFVPANSGTYYFKMGADDYGFMWLDTATTTGAKSAPPTGGNALVQNQCCSTTISAGITLTAGQGYPIRLQFANANNKSSGGLTISCSTNGVSGAYNAFTSGGPCGTLYYNPATTSSTTNPAY